MNIRIQSTPNPQARKYILDRDVKTSGKVSYQNPLQCDHIPLAYGLLMIAGVNQVHLFENVITVSQNGNKPWQDIDLNVQQIINDTINDHDPDFIESTSISVNDREDLTPEIRNIEQILDSTIRPSLQMDGGDLEVLEADLDNNTVTIRYQGACGGCPSAYEGTLQAIEQILSEHLDKPIDVVVE